jgi:hypothetical protein
VKSAARRARGERVTSGPLIIGIAILVALALALAWRYTPLGDIVTPKSTIAFAESLARLLVGAARADFLLHAATLVMFRAG